MFSRTRQARDAAVTEIEQTIKLLKMTADDLTGMRGIGSEQCIASIDELIKDYEKVRNSLHALV